MSENAAPPIGPDLVRGVPLADLEEDHPLFGHVGDSPVLVLRRGDEILAFNAVCTHYGAPLAQGIIHGDTVRCPWHHACFSLRNGEVLSPPAFNPLPRRAVSVEGGTVRVGDILKGDPLSTDRRPEGEPGSVVIVGAGAAGAYAAETLRREGYQGPVHLVDPDPDAPYDRPNLSKDYLAGEAPEDWIPLRPEGFYQEHRIERRIQRVHSFDLDSRTIVLDDGCALPFGALILATGASPRIPSIPGADGAQVHTLRSLEDCRRLIHAAHENDRVVVIGASFIGMEVAASLRKRGLDVTVVGPEERPFASTLGSRLGRFVQSLHEEKGVSFRMGRRVEAIHEGSVELDDGSEVDADLVVVGVGVIPRTDLARDAGLDVDDGILVDEYLQTSHPGVYAAGDVARYPEARLGETVRIEHWVMAQRQGRAVARNILGRAEAFTAVPFFWTEHFGVPVAYVGHAPDWDETVEEGECGEDGCAVRFVKKGKRVALATVYRDRESLREEVEMEDSGAGNPTDS